jgi:thymidylate kinase
MNTSKGDLVVRMMDELEKGGCAPVYLRNHEALPADIGNDVDLLIEPSKISKAEITVRETAEHHGWIHLKSIQFGCLSMFFSSRDGSDFVHVDLFTSLEWHFLPIANVRKIIARRQWNGLVFVPDPLDELFLNVCTRLYYQGIIREKHRAQAAALLSTEDSERYFEIVRGHVGSAAANIIVQHVIAGSWKGLELMADKCRRLLLLHVLSRRTFAFFRSLISFARRGLRRLISPPGPFIVFAGADGIGKSSVIDGCIPFMVSLTGKSDVLLFHWKPTRASVRLAGEPTGGPQDPRGKQLRSPILSLFFLCYHWLGFWTGYLRYVLPAVSRNRAVVGDRYSYEFLLDPERLRLNLPKWLRYLASFTTPKPDLVIGLVAPPEAVVLRKQELGVDEIERYQNGVKSLSKNHSYFSILEADGTLIDTIKKTQNSIITKLYP